MTDMNYHIHRLLSDPETVVGAVVHKFLGAIQNQPVVTIESINKTIDDIMKLFEKQRRAGIATNVTNTNGKAIVERWIYTRAYAPMFDAFIEQFEDAQASFIENLEGLKSRK
jgi:hypothetical protein